MSEEAMMEEQDHWQIPSDASDQDNAPMDAQFDHLWDSQFEQFLAPEDRVDAPSCARSPIPASKMPPELLERNFPLHLL
ncbi:hypothetical protein B9Z55_027999 [Caenorhabditis nigoni]|uniref:Uncharacterized protein n=1 Tax=Caenorhabditis nigoni TaxID=1611254 RepID=A0A2G5SE44_9PELO|nr:hypothetical protein B9Z55_027999 [Caenorhabditis nigoni]